MSFTKNQISELGCFVASTLVHTKEGLRPIEQIKVGDYVLSKPEADQGGSIYKRVNQTFKYDDKEVWYAEYVVLKEDHTKTKERGFFVITDNQPIWVKGYLSYEDRQFKLNELHIWESVSGLTKDMYAYEGGAVLELHDSRLAVVTTSRVGGLLMRSDIPDYGVVCTETVLAGNGGDAVIFNDGGLEITSEDVGLNYDDQLDSKDFPEDSLGHIDGFPPLLRTVYNLEVEGNHTFFIGEYGVWVHDEQKPHNSDAPTIVIDNQVFEIPISHFSSKKQSVQRPPKNEQVLDIVFEHLTPLMTENGFKADKNKRLFLSDLKEGWCDMYLMSTSYEWPKYSSLSITFNLYCQPVINLFNKIIDSDSPSKTVRRNPAPTLVASRLEWMEKVHDIEVRTWADNAEYQIRRFDQMEILLAELTEKFTTLLLPAVLSCQTLADFEKNLNPSSGIHKSILRSPRYHPIEKILAAYLIGSPTLESLCKEWETECKRYIAYMRTHPLKGQSK